MKSQSDGFGPIKQVGIAVSIGFPLFVIGVLMVCLFTISLVGITTSLWILGGTVLMAGLAASVSGRII